MIPNDDASDFTTHSFEFNGVGTFYELNSTNQNPLCGCTDEASCNYDPNALYDNGTCIEYDECEVCNLSLIHIPSPRDLSTSRMPSSA